MMRALMTWVRRHWMLVAGGVAVVAAGLSAVVVLTSPDGPPASYGAGSAKDPASLGAPFREFNNQGVPWRWGALSDVAEILPLADGVTEGRCYVTAGWIETTRAGIAEFSTAERDLSVAYYANGKLLKTGDPSAACNTSDLESRAVERRFSKLEQVLNQDGPLPQFYTVAYILEDVNPDLVVLTPHATESLNANGATASVYYFKEQPDFSQRRAARVFD
jgi:hypothetical protein